MATTDEGHNPASPTDVDLGGDVNLLVGPPGCQTRLHVSKALLSMVSSYSRVMFSSNFREGASATVGEDIKLTEDEPYAAINLLKILHMNYTAPKPMGSLELLHVAIVADKWDCAKAIYLTLDGLAPALTITRSCET